MTPNDVTFGSAKNVWWQCKKDNTHEWETPVNYRTSGSGCPYCHSSTSQPELRIYSELQSIFDKVEHRKKINKIECDVFLPEIKVAIEIDGFYWHKEKYNSDRIKNDRLLKQGIKLIRVRDKGLSKISKLDIIHPYNGPGILDQKFAKIRCTP